MDRVCPKCGKLFAQPCKLRPHLARKTACDASPASAHGRWNLDGVTRQLVSDCLLPLGDPVCAAELAGAGVELAVTGAALRVIANMADLILRQPGNATMRVSDGTIITWSGEAWTVPEPQHDALMDLLDAGVRLYREREPVGEAVGVPYGTPRFAAFIKIAREVRRLQSSDDVYQCVPLIKSAG